MFRKRLREARMEAKLTQQRMVDLLGISLNGYQKYEQGRRSRRWTRWSGSPIS